MLELVSGRPSHNDGRLLKEIKVYDLLEELGILYDRIDHEPLETMEKCKEVDDLLGSTVCKNLFLRNAQKTKFYLLMMPGDKKFKTKELSKQIQSARLSFAEVEFMESYLDITPGSVSVFGLMNDKEQKVQLIIDQDILAGDYVGCHPCINTSTLKLRTSDLVEKFLTAVKHEPILVTLIGED